MYGWIHFALEDLIVKKFGKETWQQVLTAAGHSGDFVRNMYYPDELTFKLVGACSQVLNAPVDYCLEVFGQHFAHYVQDLGYHLADSFMGRTFEEWVQNFNEVHQLMKPRFPLANFPVFWTEVDSSDPTGKTLILYYKSTRCLPSLVVGVVKEGAKVFFGIKIDMERLPDNQSDPVVVSWRIKQLEVIDEEVMRKRKEKYADMYFARPGEAHKKPLRSSTMHPQVVPHLDPSATPSQGESHVFRCPFSGETVSFDSKDLKESLASIGHPPIPTHSIASAVPPSVPLSPQSKSSAPHIGLSPQNTSAIFPFHFVINQDMKIIQVGKKLSPLLLNKSIHSFDSIINHHVDEFLSIHQLPFAEWTWRKVEELSEVSIELKVGNHSPEMILRGSIVILDPSVDDEKFTKEKCAMFLVSPRVLHSTELHQAHLHISDIPIHNFQRDVILLGDHLKNETELGVKLDQLSKRLKQEQRISIESLKTKRCFVRYVSHEIRSPLNITLLGLQYLENELKSIAKPGLMEIFDDVKSSCSIAVKILNELLLYEKIESGILALNRVEMPASIFVDQSLKSLKLQAKGAGVELEIQKIFDRERVHLNVDQMKLSQVLTNLVSNALKFVPQDQGKVEIRCAVISTDTVDREISFTSTENNILSSVPIDDSAPADSFIRACEEKGQKCFFRISVIDNGPGISMEDQKLLFREFSQVQAEKLQNGQGSGLGLWIANTIVRMHLGRMGVFSEGEGQGCEFIVDLPMSEDCSATCNHDPGSLCNSPSPANPKKLEATAERTESSPRTQPRKVTAVTSMRGDSIDLLIPEAFESLQIAPPPPTFSESDDEGTDGPPETSDNSHTTTPRSPFCSPRHHRVHSKSHYHFGRRGSQVSHTISPRVDTQCASPALQASAQPAIESPPLCVPSSEHSSSPPAHHRKSPAHPPSADLKQPDDLAKRRVLLVDDVSLNRKMLHRMIKSRFLVIEEAGNGQEAVAKFSRAAESGESFDIVMMDYFMPVMNGLEATKLIRQMSPSVLIVGATGNGLKEDLEAFEASGANRVMIKPLKPEDLLEYASNFFAHRVSL